MGFWGAKFFEKEFPNYQTEFSIINALTILILGVSASYTGGYVSDLYAGTKPQMKALVGGLGAVVSFPFIIIAFTLSNNFWVSMISYLVSYFPGEMWLGPAFAMVQTMFPSQIIGTATAVFGFTGGIAGALSNILLGALGDYFKTDKNAKISGYLITGCLGISYIGCAPLFVLAGFMFRSFVFKERKSSIVIRSEESLKDKINDLKENN